MHEMHEEWWRDVLRFWFKELGSDGWFERKDETDEMIRLRFLDLHRRMSQAIPTEAFLDREAALAAIIVFDQFPRNVFRGTAEAFATDRLAIAVARNALENGFDRSLAEEQRLFLYMPFMHSEALADQERCVDLFKTLSGDVLKHAIEHRDIIAKFGRFPHRNSVLRRETTDEESSFLAGHKGFGQ
jgi:uncharacterized protein (DUF924 family)